MTRTELLAEVKQVQADLDVHRKQAPNARDFPNWDAFYEAQAAHELRATALQREIDVLNERVWSLG